jgi:hypothetical protein
VARSPVLRLRRVAAVIPSQSVTLSPSKMSLLSRELTKLHVWSLHSYGQVLFVDVRSVFVQDPLPMFDLCVDSPLCASPLLSAGAGAGCYSTAMMVLTPCADVYNSLMVAAAAATGVGGAEGGGGEGGEAGRSSGTSSSDLRSLFPAVWSRRLSPAPARRREQRQRQRQRQREQLGALGAEPRDRPSVCTVS